MDKLTTEQKLLMVKLELDQAKRKHPHFVDEVTSSRLDDMKKDLSVWRDLLAMTKARKKVCVFVVLRCELAEALEAYLKGDYEHARQEFAQCAAVCVRAMEECEKAHKKWEARNDQ